MIRLLILLWNAYRRRAILAQRMTAWRDGKPYRTLNRWS